MSDVDEIAAGADAGSERPLYRRIADDIAAQIRLGVYPAGSRIPSLRRLQAQYAVSLTTVLEACRRLEDVGLIHAQPQSGHYVRFPDAVTRQEPDASSSSIEARRVDASLAVRLNLGIGNPQRPTLGAAVQGPELMPIAALNRLMSQVLRQQPESCHSYDAPPGSPALRRAIAERGMEAGYSVTPDEIVITSGAKEAVYLSICAITRPGDTVAIESPPTMRCSRSSNRLDCGPLRSRRTHASASIWTISRWSCRASRLRQSYWYRTSRIQLVRA